MTVREFPKGVLLTHPKNWDRDNPTLQYNNGISGKLYVSFDTITETGASIGIYQTQPIRERGWQYKAQTFTDDELEALSIIFERAANAVREKRAEKEAKKPDFVVFVPSFTQPNVAYTVGMRNFLSKLPLPVSCDCPDFVNRSQQNPAHECKHMRFVTEHPAAFMQRGR